MSIEGDKRPRLPAGSAAVLFRSLPSEPKLTLGDRRGIREFASKLSREVAGSASFTCLISNDRELHRLNYEFLNHNFPTDVLSFPATEGGTELGEIAISLERANAQAAEFGHSCSEEVRVLMLHGILHLTGFDHERDRGEMARAERKWRAFFDLPSTLIARTKRAGKARVE